MASDLFSIGRSGTRAARTGLEVTAQNIANAGAAGYVRRSTGMAEIASTGWNEQTNDISVSGVRVDRVVRNADPFRQAEVRRTGSDTARADAELQGLQNLESALEQSNVYTGISEFEGAVAKLNEDPVSTSLRASVIESARTMTSSFQIAAQQLASVGEGLRFQATDGVTQVNRISAELARTNLRLSRAADQSSDQSALLDQRDKLLEDLSGFADIATEFATNGSVQVRLGGSAGPVLLQGGTADVLSMTTAANGTVSFSLATGGAVALSGGSLAGQALALGKLDQLGGDLDALAASIAGTVNAAQANGAALDGSAGQPMFSGNTAKTLTLVASNGTMIATAPAGSPANSRDVSNLAALQSALTTANPAGGMDAILFDISGTVSGRAVTREALTTISDAARTALAAQSGVDLDTEALNLVRFQQAFQASGRVIQVAADLFDTLLGLR